MLLPFARKPGSRDCWAARDLREGGLTQMNEVGVLKRREMSRRKRDWQKSSYLCQDSVVGVLN